MQPQSLNRDWLFYPGDPPRVRWQEPDVSNWRRLDLPHDWSIEGERQPANPSSASGGYFPMGHAWYRKTLAVPEAWRGKTVLVEFEGVYMNAEIWLNEHFLGRHPYGYTSFTCDLAPYLNYGADNVLKVNVDNACQLNSRWYSGSGIYRPVWLYVAEAVHIGHWGIAVTTPQVSTESATVRVSTRLENSSTADAEISLRIQLLAPDGQVVGSAAGQVSLPEGGQAEVVQELQVSVPLLWSPDAPHLYRLESEALVAGRVVDSATTTFGIRSLDWDAEGGFRLNDQTVKMKGGCVHHDDGVLGAASYARSEERKVEVLKASGFNAIRCAHNPPAPAFLEACDRLGMLVIDEAFDCWREGKNPYDYHVAFDEWWRWDIESMVNRDRNHPSVVVWSIGNELPERDGHSGGIKLARRLADTVRALDPTRPITAAINGFREMQPWERTDGIFAALDIGGYNYQWRQYRPDHERLPERVMFGTESFPGEAFENWTSVEQLNYVVGDFVWTSLDYLGESGIGRVHFGGEQEPFLGRYPWHQANCGDLDLCGFKRPQSYYRDILWGSGAPLYIAVHDPIPAGQTPTITLWGWPEVWPNWNWPGREGQAFQVDVYSACEQVELFLNGRSLGLKPAGRVEKHIASFEVPYEPGELKAVGYNAGQLIAESAIQTTGAPAQLRLSPDRNPIRAEGNDLCYLTVEIVDEQGRVHPAADRPVFFTIKGTGTIAAVGNGNPVSLESYRGHQRQTYRGRCLVVVKSDGQTGEIRLHAQADGLDGAEAVIRTV